MNHNMIFAFRLRLTMSPHIKTTNQHLIRAAMWLSSVYLSH